MEKGMSGEMGSIMLGKLLST